jgi:hypothetical protein
MARLVKESYTTISQAIPTTRTAILNTTTTTTVAGKRFMLRHAQVVLACIGAMQGST